MALWILNRPAEKCGLGELQVAEHLARLPDDWVVRWGFYYQDQAGTTREGDFLVLGPHGGLLVLESKGGRIELNPYTGKWNTPDGDNPQYQLDAEWSGVLDVVGRHSRGFPSLYVGRALATPGLTLPPDARDLHGIDRCWIFDTADLRNFAETWVERMRLWGAKLDGRSRDVFFQSYGKDATPKAVRHFIDETDRMLIAQTEAEYEMLDALGENGHFLVQGGTGSGKTWLALELACRWAVGGAGRRVLLLCYNLALTERLREMTDRARARKRLRQGEVIVRSWEDLSRELFDQAGLKYEPPAEGPERTLFYEQELPQLLAQIVKENLCSLKFDALVVDEAQDHDTSIPAFPENWTGPGWWGVYWSLLNHGPRARIAAFYDAAQRPAFRGGGGFEPGALRRVSGFEPVQLKLTRTVRYSRPLFHFLKGLKSDALVELKAGLVQRGPLPDGPDVVLCEADRSTVAIEAERILFLWFNQGWCRPEQVLVLSRHGRMHRSALDGCNELAGKPLVNHLERRSGEIGMLSVNRAKGLDALAVILVDYAPWVALREDDHIGFFMGASRARLLLAVIQTTGMTEGTADESQ